MGGGLPCGAIGGVPEIMDLVTDKHLRAGRHLQRQPAHDGGGRATLLEESSRRGLRRASNGCGTLQVAGSEEVLRRYALPGYVQSFGAKGAVIFTNRLNDYRDFLGYDDQ